MCVSVLVSGILGGFVLTMAMVAAVVADAGSTSTAATLKRLLLNHMQMVAMLLHFDLNWSPSIKQFFSLLGAVSSVGDDLIQSGCILNSNDEINVRPFYITQVGFILMPCLILLPGTIFLIYQHGCGCCEKPMPTKNDENVHRRIAELMRIRAQQSDGKHESLEEIAELRASYNHVLDELRTSGIVDVETASQALADSSAIARLRARDFMEHCRLERVNLRQWFREFDERNVGSIKVTDFIMIVKSIGLHWSEEDYTCVAGLFGDRAARNGGGGVGYIRSGRVSLAKIMSFKKTFWDRWFVMLMTVCYVLYPTITRKVFDALSCRSGLMEGSSTSYLWEDLEISCTSAEHIAFLIFISTPGLLLYIIGFPGFSLLSLQTRLKKKGWTNDTTMFRYAVLMSGYKHERWYWEAVICMRKVLLTMTAVFLKNYGPELQFIFASLVLMIAVMFQVRERPFANKELNALENWSLGLLFVSLYLGLFFFWDLLGSAGKEFLGFIIIASNILYMVWLSGSLFREYMARHHNKTTNWISQHLHTENPLVLCLLSVPFGILLGCLSIFNVCLSIFTCGHRFGPYARKKIKDVPLSAVIPEDLLKRQKMKLKEAISFHLEQAKIIVKTMKHFKRSEETLSVRKSKLVHGHSRSQIRLANRMEDRHGAEAAAKFRERNSETGDKLFGADAKRQAEIKLANAQSAEEAKNRNFDKNVKMFELVGHASSLAIAKRTTDEHEKTAALKALRHLESAKKGKERLEMRLMRRAAKLSSSVKPGEKPGEKDSTNTDIDSEIKLEKKGGGQEKGKAKAKGKRNGKGRRGKSKGKKKKKKVSAMEEMKSMLADQHVKIDLPFENLKEDFNNFDLHQNAAANIYARLQRKKEAETVSQSSLKKSENAAALSLSSMLSADAKKIKTSMSKLIKSEKKLAGIMKMLDKNNSQALCKAEFEKLCRKVLKKDKSVKPTTELYHMLWSDVYSLRKDPSQTEIGSAELCIWLELTTEETPAELTTSGETKSGEATTDDVTATSVTKIDAPQENKVKKKKKKKKKKPHKSEIRADAERRAKERAERNEARKKKAEEHRNKAEAMRSTDTAQEM